MLLVQLQIKIQQHLLIDNCTTINGSVDVFKTKAAIAYIMMLLYDIHEGVAMTN